MLRRIIAFLTLILVANISQSHDPPNIPDCRTHTVINSRMFITSVDAQQSLTIRPRLDGTN